MSARQIPTFLIALAILLTCRPAPAAEPQLDIPWVDAMPRVPRPLHVIDWKKTATDYDKFVLDPDAKGGNLPAVQLSEDRRHFGMGSYLASRRADKPDPVRKPGPGIPSGEALACLSAVTGAQLLGLDMRTLHGVDWVQDCRRWFNAEEGIFRNRPGQKGGVISHVVYGYWPLALGTMLAGVNHDDPDYRKAIERQFAFVLQMARAMGCPEQPNLKQGYDVAARKVTVTQIDWNPGNASCLAWMLYAGYQFTGDPEYLECAKACLRWQEQNPGRYEVSHVMGPLTLARINAEQGADFDMGWMMDNWFGDYTRRPGFVHSWAITHGTHLNGMTCDGLDGAWWRRADNNGFYAFAMGSYQAPAWLIPTARYDQRYARAIARYALNAANSCRFFLGIDLDWEHQDHKVWRDSFPGGLGYLFSYEGLRTEAHAADAQHRFQPYGTGDVLALFSKRYGKKDRLRYWEEKKNRFSKTSENIAIYMGNHIGFLGAIFNATDVEGIIAWELTRTDYYRPKCYPSYLIYNPFEETKTVRFDLGAEACDVYDAVTGTFLKHNVRGSQSFTLTADQSRVLVLAPAGGKLELEGRKLKINGIVVDYRCGGAPEASPGPIRLN